MDLAWLQWRRLTFANRVSLQAKVSALRMPKDAFQPRPRQVIEETRGRLYESVTPETVSEPSTLHLTIVECLRHPSPAGAYSPAFALPRNGLSVQSLGDSSRSVQIESFWPSICISTRTEEKDGMLKITVTCTATEERW